MNIAMLLSKIFNPKKITMLGRAGILYKRGDKTYFIDSECLTGNPDIVLYSDKVYLQQTKDKRKAISEHEKSIFVREVKQELVQQKLIVENFKPSI